MSYRDGYQKAYYVLDSFECVCVPFDVCFVCL